MTKTVNIYQNFNHVYAQCFHVCSKPLDTCGEFYSYIYEMVSKKCINRRIVVLKGKGIPLLCKNDLIELRLIQIGLSAPIAHAVQTDSGKTDSGQSRTRETYGVGYNWMCRHSVRMDIASTSLEKT